MDLLQGLLLITSIHLLAAASPGPDFVLVSQQTLNHGKQAGLMCSIGIALGLSVHILYSALGLAAVIANSSSALWLIKVLGGSYLIYLGIKSLKSTPGKTDSTQSTAPKSPLNWKKGIGLGFLCNALNPKAPVYFVALFTLVLSPQMPLYQIAIYGMWMMLIQLAWFSSLVMLLSRPTLRRGYEAFAQWINRLLGGAMIILGLKVILVRNS